MPFLILVDEKTIQVLLEFINMNRWSLDLRFCFLDFGKEEAIDKVRAKGRQAGYEDLWLVKYSLRDAINYVHGNKLVLRLNSYPTWRITIKLNNQQQFFYFTYFPLFAYFFCNLEPRISPFSAPSGFAATFDPALMMGLSFSPVTRSTFFGSSTCETVVSN